MSRKLLTLGMSYNEKFLRYNLLCYDLLRYKIISLELSEEDIHMGHNMFFDIGGITEVEELREEDVYYPVGTKRLLGKDNRLEIQKVLEKKQINIESFLMNKIVDKYSIIKVQQFKILRFSANNNLLMEFYSGGSRQAVLIKDYRWIAYSKHLYENKNALEECQKLLAREDKDIYLVMCKEEHKHKHFVSIVGVHYLQKRG